MRANFSAERIAASAAVWQNLSTWPPPSSPRSLELLENFDALEKKFLTTGTSLDAAMTLWFHIAAHSRGASEFKH